MDAESTGYRFLDAQSRTPSLSHSPTVHAVEFLPSIDDYVYIVKQRTKANASLRSYGKLSVQTFFFINAIGLPAVLLIFGHPLLALAVLAINLALVTLFIPTVFRFDYGRYFRDTYGPDFESELVRVELSEEGILTRYVDDVSFHSWRSVTDIGETDESFYFHIRGSSIPVRKNGFPYEEARQAFINFARSRQAERHALLQ